MGFDDSDDPQPGDLEEPSSDTLPCPGCREMVFEDADRCPHCGQWIMPLAVSARGRPLIWILLAVMLILGVLSWSIF